jgi:hypothetical protein
MCSTSLRQDRLAGQSVLSVKKREREGEGAEAVATLHEQQPCRSFWHP